MKISFSFHFSCLFALSLSSLSMAAGGPPYVVQDVDISRYAGRWYEVASSKPTLRKDCICSTSDYTLQPDATVTVVNTCRKKTLDGPLEIAEGYARPSAVPAAWMVTFDGIEFKYTNYWIVALADDYRYAVVTTFLRDPIYVLSRTPEIASADMEAIRSEIQKNGLNPLKLQATLQAGCSYISF